MKLCYADSKDTMADTNDSITQWVIGAGLAAMTTILGFLMKWVFGRLTGGIEELRREMAANAERDVAGHEKIANEMRTLNSTVQKQDMSIALMAKDLAHLQEAHNHLLSEFERHCENTRVE